MLFFMYTQTSQRNCVDVYLVQFEKGIGSEGSGLYELEVTESNWIIPYGNNSGDRKLTLNVTTNSILSANTLYQATLITTMDMTEAGRFQFCKWYCHMTVGDL